MSRELTVRPHGHDYRAELEKRFAGRAHLCHLEAIGSGAEQRKPYTVAEGVAIINISGALVGEAWWWDETEYSQIQREVKMAVEDAEVKSILLAVASPGGEAYGCPETAEVIRVAGQKKPLRAVASEYAFSAAYWLASAAAEIWLPDFSGAVGSVGVWCAHVDYSEALEKAGVKVTLLSAGKGKTDGNPYEPLSDSARKKIQAEVNRCYDAFVSDVAMGRKMSPDDIRKIGAEIFHGASAAIAAGYADQIGDMEAAWYALATLPEKSSSMAASAMTSTEEVPAVDTTDKKTADAKPTAEEVAALVAKATEDGYGAAAEIVELCAIAGRPASAVQFVAERKSVKDVRTALLVARANESDKEQIVGSTKPDTGTKVEDKGADYLKADAETRKGGK